MLNRWLLIFVCLLSGFSAVGQTYFSRQSGPWNDVNTWSNTAGGPPASEVPGSFELDRATIVAPHVVTLPAGGQFNFMGQGLTIDAGGTLDANNRSIALQLVGTFTINGTLLRIGTLITQGDVSLNAPNTVFNSISVEAHYSTFGGGGGRLTYLSNITSQGVSIIPGSDEGFYGANVIARGSFSDVSSYDFFSGASGNMENPATWRKCSHTGPVASTAPSGSDGTVHVGTGHTITLNADFLPGAMSFVVETGATVNAQGNDLQFSGAIDINGTGTITNGGNLIVSLCGGTISASQMPVFQGIVIDDPGCDGTTTLNTDIVAFNGVSYTSSDGIFDPNFYIVYPCIPPTNSTNASNAQDTNPTGTSITFSWTNPASGSNGAMVVVRRGGTTQYKPNPGTTYTANSVYGSAGSLITGAGSESYVVYKGTGNSVTITGLTPNTSYEVGVYQFLGTNCYNIGSFLGASFNPGMDTAPLLTFNPVNGAANVPVASNLTITATEALRKLDNSVLTNADLSTLVELKLTNDAGASVPFTGTIDATKTIITIDPNSALNGNTVYYLELNPVEDLADNATFAQNITFTTADATPPGVTFNPLNAATNVNTSQNIVLTFTEPVRNVDNTAFTNANAAARLVLKLTNAAGADIPFTATVAGGATGVTLNPTANLPDESVIYVAVSGLEDAADNAMTAQSITFTTGDFTPPTITFSPLNSAVNVDVTSVITLTFSEPVEDVDGTSISSAETGDLFIFKLTNAAGANVPFTSTINGASTVITIDPNSNLLPNQLYYLRYDVVQDASGNITTAGNITFTTRTGPSITSFTPVTACIGESVVITGTNFGTAVPGVSISGTSGTVTAHSATSITFTVPNAAGGTITVTNNDDLQTAVSSASLTINPAITNNLAVAANPTSILTGGTSSITVANSQTGISYQLKRTSPNPTSIGTAQAGSGSTLTFSTNALPTGGNNVFAFDATRAGCATVTLTNTATVSVNTLTVNAGAFPPQCEGASLTLGGLPTASGGSGSYVYAWTSTPAGFTSTEANPAVTLPAGSTTYNLSVTDSNFPGPAVTSSIGFVAVSLPATVAITGSSTFCRNKTDAGYTATARANTTYRWTVPAGATIVSGQGTNSIIVNFGTTGGTISVVPINTSLCEGPEGTLAVTPIADPTSFTVTGGGIYCGGPNGVKIGLSDAQSDITYEVYRDNVATGNTKTGTDGAFDFNNLLTLAGSYTVRGRNTSGCEVPMNGAVAVTLSNPPAGSGNIAGIGKLCPGVEGTYTVSGITNATGYVWDVPAGIEVVSQSGVTATLRAVSGSGGTINVNGQNQCGAGGAAKIDVGLLATPDVSIVVGSDQVFIDDAVDIAYESSASIQSQSWTLSDGFTSSEASFSHIFSSSGDVLVSLEVSDDQGCENTASTTVKVNSEADLSSYSIRNVVTANGDNFNGVLFIKLIERFPDSEVIFLDRLGVEIFRKENYQNDWDLRQGEEFVAAGTYVCIVKNNGKIYSRSVTVLKDK